MASLLTKVAKGIAFGDVSNSSVRNILTELSKQIYGKFTEQEMYDTLKFFDWKCPYTGKYLRDAIDNDSGGYVTDHIYPQNKEYCGLNVKGNLVIVDKAANNRKGSKSVQDFLCDRNNDDILGPDMNVRQARLEKIKEFQRFCGYDPVAIQKKLGPLLEDRYNQIRKEQEQWINDAIKATGMQKLATSNTSSSGVVASNQKRRNTVTVIFNPSNETLFKEKLLETKKAEFVLTYSSGKVVVSSWNAEKLDENSNIRANIQSRPFWRVKDKEGLETVEVSIVS